MMKEELVDFLKGLQKEICAGLETVDGSAKFCKEEWERVEGGGGITSVIENGKVFEKGGVNFSAVHGKTPEFLLSEKQHSLIRDTKKDLIFFATGLSIVIHPINPFVPIIHMNIRYFEMNDGTRWLGGGIDLTPHYIDDKEASFFHSELKKVCDRYDLGYYEKFKKWADDYFFIPHRNETRGIGGIFFDRISDSQLSFSENVNFWKEIGKAFLPIYATIVNQKKLINYTDENKRFQYLRRGRYVEFNLVYDKGTKFGLETNGRIESILMSLPKYASWEYDVKFHQNSMEENTLNQLKKGINYLD